jgi:hypothetical protein
VRCVDNPLFTPSLFRIRAFTWGIVAKLCASLGRGGLQFILIIWLQRIWLPQHGYRTLLNDFVEPSRRHVEDEAAHGVLLRDERAVPDPGERLADVLFDIGEGFGGPWRLDTDFFLD